MPGIQNDDIPSPEKQGEGIARTVYIYDLTDRNEAVYQNGFFTEVNEALIEKVTSDENGYFSVALAPGSYSILIEEEQGLYANFFDGEGNIHPVHVYPDSVSHIDVIVDYKAAY